MDDKNAAKKRHYFPFWRAVVAVLSGLIGIRRRQHADEDMERIHPVHIVLVGVGMVALFVTTILLVVKLVV